VGFGGARGAVCQRAGDGNAQSLDDLPAPLKFNNGPDVRLPIFRRIVGVWDSALSQQIHERDPCQTEFLGGLAGGNLAAGKQGQDGFQVFLESRHYGGVGGDVEFNLQFHGTLMVSRAGLMTLYGVVESSAARLRRMRTSLELLIEKAGGVLGAVTATKSARWTSSR
jgi:hypothetical protein